MAQWVAAWVADFSRKACKKWGFGNMDKKSDVKTQGSAPGHRQNLVFYSTFLSVSKTPMEFSRFICFLGAVLGPPLSRPQNRRFHTKTLIAGSHFQKPDQIVISGMFEGFRCGQNLAKYVIHAVFQRFEALKTSQNT